jgi:hypothetical protein
MYFKKIINFCSVPDHSVELVMTTISGIFVGTSVFKKKL